MAKAETRVLTTHIPVPLAEKVDQVAERLTREALADVDAGRIMDHQAVQAWADSLSTDKPQSDLKRRYEFLAPLNQPAATKAV